MAGVLDPVTVRAGAGVFSLGAGLLLAACAGEGGREVTLRVRTDLPDELRSYVERTFEEAHPTVDVRYSTGTPERSLDDVSASVAPDEPPFDVWWGVPARTLEAAATDGLLTPYRPDWMESSGEARIGPARVDDAWQFLLTTPYVLAFNREELQLTRAPRDWLDLFHFRWTDDVEVLDPTRSEAGAWLVGSTVARYADSVGVDVGFEWLTRLDGQVDAYAPDSEAAIAALRAGVSSVAILPRVEVERRRSQGDAWLYYRMPESGTPVLGLGVAIVDRTPALDAARAFVDHLGGTDVATEAKRATHWDPAYGRVDEGRIPPDFEIERSWSPYPLDGHAVSTGLDSWLERWEVEVRGKG